MNKYILLIVCWIMWTANAAEGNEPLSDSEVLTSALSSAVQTLLEPQNNLEGAAVHIAYAQFCTPSRRSREILETILTRLGCALTDAVYDADYRLTVAITDARVVLMAVESGYRRTVSVMVHVTCLDNAHRVVIAAGREETVTDEIASKALDATDNSAQFCSTAKRYVVEKNGINLRSISFIVFSAILVYFAFQ